MSARCAPLALCLSSLFCVFVFLPRAGLRAEEEKEDEGLRQHLTEREDKRRPLEPWSFDVCGRPLTIGGEYEIEVDSIRRRVYDPEPGTPNRVFLEQGLELEVFYSFGPELSLFAQARPTMEEDLLPDTFEEVSDYYVERGEMWLYSENIAGTHLNFDIGHLDFEDDRRWWWDDELDALRIAWELESVEIAFAAARELLPDRSDRDYVDPEQDGVLRLIGEAAWDWHDDHSLQAFLLHQEDQSDVDQPGEMVRTSREDDTDAWLTWLGARATGVVDLGAPGLLGYWLDTALVRGEQRVAELGEPSNGRSQVEELVRRDVSGWAIDLGLSVMLGLALEPRLYAGYAHGSGDESPDSATDRSFRQTGIQDNEAGYGGVERFSHYGFLFDPELSNLGVWTLGAGLSLFDSSSLDFVYHRYRQVELADSLPDSRLEATLTGENHAIGQEIDLVLAIEEWERLELFFVASGFRADRAFGEHDGEWSYGGVAALRYAF
jgi:hypothetical protein